MTDINENNANKEPKELEALENQLTEISLYYNDQL